MFAAIILSASSILSAVPNDPDFKYIIKYLTISYHYFSLLISIYFNLFIIYYFIILWVYFMLIYNYNLPVLQIGPITGMLFSVRKLTEYILF